MTCLCLIKRFVALQTFNCISAGLLLQYFVIPHLFVIDEKLTATERFLFDLHHQTITNWYQKSDSNLQFLNNLANNKQYVKKITCYLRELTRCNNAQGTKYNIE